MNSKGLAAVRPLEVYVGLDYHTSFVQASILDEMGCRLWDGRCGNDAVEIAARASRYGTVRRAALEACSGAADLADELVTVAGWNVSLAHAGYVNRMKHNPDKTDYGDAQILADLCRTGYLPEVWLPPEHIRDLRSLVHHRHQLVRRRTADKVRVSSLLRDRRVAEPGVRRWTIRWLAWLQDEAVVTKTLRYIIDSHLRSIARLSKEIQRVEKLLKQMTRSDPVVAELLQEEGIGPITAYTMRAEIGRFDRFRNGKQLSKYCGLSPRNASTGKRQADAGLIKSGNRDLKTMLLQAAHRLIRRSPRWSALAASLRKRGKATSVVVAAVANRWIRSLHHRLVGETA